MDKNSTAFTFPQFSIFHKNEMLSWISYMNKWCALLKENMSKVDMYDFSYLCKFGLKTCCLLPNFRTSLKIKIEQNSLISLIYFNNLLSFYLTMTRVGRHDKMLKTTFWKYIIYDTHNTTLWHTYHIMHTHTPHSTHITVILNHLDAQNFDTQQR